MRVFDQAKADAVKMLTVGSSILTFCSIGCRIDFVNSVYTVYAGGLYGCWQCGEDMLQGLLLNKPADDDNLYRQRRQRGDVFTSPTGRIATSPELQNIPNPAFDMRWLRTEAGKRAINYPIQGADEDEEPEDCACFRLEDDEADRVQQELDEFMGSDDPPEMDIDEGCCQPWWEPCCTKDEEPL